MFKFFDKVKKSKVGYTLTELIVVVAILGILAAIGAPMIINSIAKARQNSDDTSIKAIETAVQLCLANEELQTVSGVIKDMSGNETGIAAAVQKRLVGNAYPKHNVASAEKWQLSLSTGKVISTSAAATPGGTVNLD
jgi:type IV pilus assembly protein PilA